MTYGYIRVSSDKQTVENQRFEITRYCKKEGITIDGWIEETISGTKMYNKRELGKLLSKLKKNDIIICAELSRLGRSFFMIMEILSLCMKKECKVLTIKDNYQLGDDLQSKILAFTFALAAEIERTFISQRTKEALARRKNEGMKLGRPKGSKNKHLKLSKQENKIKELMNSNTTKKDIASICGVSRSTLNSFIKNRGISQNDT